MTDQKYTALPLISLCLRVLAYAVVVLGILTALYYLVAGKPVLLPLGLPQSILDQNKPGFIRGHLIPAFWELFNSTIRGLLLLGVAEGIHLFLDIEDNTRRAAERVDAAISSSPPPAVGLPPPGA